VEVSYGEGDSFQEAEVNLREAKALREKAGARPARGAQPRSVVTKPPARRDIPGEREEVTPYQPTEAEIDKSLDDMALEIQGFRVGDRFPDWFRNKGWTKKRVLATIKNKRGTVYRDLRELTKAERATDGVLLLTHGVSGAFIYKTMLMSREMLFADELRVLGR
jgi:hypothetical protein